MPECVAADGREEVDRRAEARSPDRLVRALAAVVDAEGAADHRLPRAGHALELDREADPVASDDRDLRHAGDSMEELVKDRPWSTVWRVDGGLWRKQCKSIWRFEPALTVALAARWPDRMPEVVDHGGDWLLLRDAGAMIEDLPNAHAVWLEAIARYAELQRGEIAHIDDHLANGVVDQRTALLPAGYADLLSRDELPWPPGARERLQAFEPTFARLCDELEDLASVNHDDLHIHNVFEGPRILDWGDSCVSHPFFSLVVTFNFVETGQDEIRDAYLEAYGGGRETFDLALRVGRLAHLNKWLRFRDVLEPESLAEYDNWFGDWIARTVAQTIE